MVIRSHEVKHQGYQVEHNGRCVTIFSAPNYWYGVYSWNRCCVNTVFVHLAPFSSVALTLISILYFGALCVISDSVGNKGAYINVTPETEKGYKLDYVQFDAVEHPKTQPYSNKFRGGF